MAAEPFRFPGAAGQTLDGRLDEPAGKTLGTPVTVAAFVRFEHGEGIEKAPTGDFAAEVAKMAGG
jgi:translation elongation factor EF-Ts